MARIREHQGRDVKRKTLVLAWTGTRYAEQERKLKQLTGSREAVEYIMAAIRHYESQSQKDQDERTQVLSEKITEQPQKQEIRSAGISLSPEQRKSLKGKYTL